LEERSHRQEFQLCANRGVKAVEWMELSSEAVQNEKRREESLRQPWRMSVRKQQRKTLKKHNKKERPRR
jgi:hypothetical protein